MTGYERALRTLRFEQTDCVATWGGWIVSAEFFEYVTGRPFWDDPLGVACQAYQKLETDIVLRRYYLPNSPEEWRSHVDPAEFAARTAYQSPEDVVGYIASLPPVESLAADFDFDGVLAEERSGYAELQDRLGGEIFCLPHAQCAKFVWFMDFGFENFLMAMSLYRTEIRRLFEHAAETARLHNTALAELVRTGEMPPFFFTGHDICGTRGPMASPALLREVYFPYLKRAFAPLVEVGAELIWHCDGYIPPILDDLAACGASGFQGFQEETGFSIGQVAAQRVRGGRKPIVLAGLSIDKVLPLAEPAEVRRQIDRIVSEAGHGGGLAIGTANTAGPDCRNENLEMLYTYTHQCRT